MYINLTPTKKELRQFGLLMGLMISLVFGLAFPWLFDYDFPLWPAIVTGGLWLVALIFPMGLKWIYVSWMKFAFVLGWINTRIILGLMFYAILTPIGLLMRLLDKKPIKVLPTNVDTYRRVSRQHEAERFKYPF